MVPISELQAEDRWILSKLQSMIGTVTESLRKNEIKRRIA